MRLFYKVYLILIAFLCLILGGSGYLDFLRETAHLDRDMEKHAQVIGRSISSLVEHIWKISGEDKALALIREANKVNKEEHNIKFRWVWLDSSTTAPYVPQVPLTRLDKVRQTKWVTLTMKTEDNKETRFTYVPVSTGGQRQGALELYESLLPLKRYTFGSILHVTATSSLELLVAGLVLWVLFRVLINHPLSRLTDKARKIGKGDLTLDLAFSGRDELSQLGRTMNSMCEQLNSTREKVRVEHENRIKLLEQLRYSERLATVGRLSAGLAHELGTPLNVIEGYSKHMLAGNLEQDKVIDCSSIIVEQTERMTKIIRRLLDFARRRKPERSLVNVEGLTNELFEILSPIARKKQISFNLNLKGKIPQVAMDPEQIQQMLTNLIMNGIQAMPYGGRLVVDIGVKEARYPSVKAGTKKTCLRIRVKDEGEGITKENMERLFEPFFTTKEVGQGTGLGLSIVYGIIEDHGGWIDVKSEPDKGACFTTYLPMEA